MLRGTLSEDMTQVRPISGRLGFGLTTVQDTHMSNMSMVSQLV